MPWLFALTLFVSATLLFLVQPMIAKMLLPLLGGTPAVWNTCMVFFQALLLLGYGYAHLTTSWFGDPKQSKWHLLVLVLPLALLVLPMALPTGMTPPGGDNPIPWLLLVLTLTVGLPFFVVSTSAPLLQKWFASTGHPSAKDPYFLYGASNLGSMLALLGYPFVVEPYLPLADRSWELELPFGLVLPINQTWVWTLGFGLLVVMTAVCAWQLWRALAALAGAGRKVQAKQAREARAAELEQLPPGQRLWWIALAFVPSSLMLGVTTYMTTDIAAIPLLWVIPLALYLASFILVFARIPEFVHRLMILALPVLLLLLIFMMLSEIKPKMSLLIAWHLIGFFVAAMVCHGELARTRPSTKFLTEFYLLMSVGGVLGGLFNALLAPLVFNTIAEYALTMVIACLLLPALDPEKESRTRPILDLSSIGVLVLMGLGLLCWRWYKTGDDETALSFAGIFMAMRPVGLIGFVALLAAALVWYVLRSPHERQARTLDVALAGALGLLVIGLIFGLPRTGIASWLSELFDEWYREIDKDATGLMGIVRGFLRQTTYGKVLAVLTYGIPAILCYTFVERPIRFGLGLGAMLLASASSNFLDRDVLLRERSFFGALKVEKGERDSRVGYPYKYHSLMHGTTMHGQQHLFDPVSMPAWCMPLASSNSLEVLVNLAVFNEKFDDPAREALSYYHKTGPIGQTVLALAARKPKPKLAVIGLGTGTMASYAEEGQLLHYYDIDQAVVDIAENTRYFTYLHYAKVRGVNLKIILGDARVRMEQRVRDYPDEKYDLIVVDAFSSDAIPIHLITHEALEVYRNKLSEDGIVAFHISNRHLRLDPVVARLAEKADMVALVQNDDEENQRVNPGKSRSHWTVLARDRKHLGTLAEDKRWEEMKPDPEVGLWTDNFSNVIKVFDWR